MPHVTLAGKFFSFPTFQLILNLFLRILVMQRKSKYDSSNVTHSMMFKHGVKILIIICSLVVDVSFCISISNTLLCYIH